MQPKLIVTFDRLSENGFLTKARSISTSLQANPDFPEPWPAVVPSLAKLNEAINNHQNAYLAGLTGDRQKIALRKTTRKELNDVLSNIARYLELAANGNQQMLVGTGYDLRKESATASTHAAPLQAPKFVVKHGELRGTMIGRANRLAGAASYEAHLTNGDPTVEENWIPVGVFARCSRIEINNLDVGKLYSFRLRGIGGSGPGAWSSPFNLMAL